MTDYARGQWEAFNRVLALLQTYDMKMVDKRTVYEDVFELRPRVDDFYPTPMFKSSRGKQHVIDTN